MAFFGRMCRSKASYILMSIMLFVYVVIMMVAFMMRFDPTAAYIG